MPVTIQLPEEIECQLREDDPHLDEHAREQFLIANYQAGVLSTGDLALILGFDTRSEAEHWLGTRQVRQNYSSQNLADDLRTLETILGPERP